MHANGNDYRENVGFVVYVSCSKESLILHSDLAVITQFMATGRPYTVYIYSPDDGKQCQKLFSRVKEARVSSPGTRSRKSRFCTRVTHARAHTHTLLAVAIKSSLRRHLLSQTFPRSNPFRRLHYNEKFISRTLLFARVQNSERRISRRGDRCSTVATFVFVKRRTQLPSSVQYQYTRQSIKIDREGASRIVEQRTETLQTPRNQ